MQQAKAAFILRKKGAKTMNQSIKNRNIVLSLKVLTHIMNNFADIFVSLYFLQVSQGNLMKLIIYRMSLCIMIPTLFFLTGQTAKSRKRIWLLRGGMAASLAYFVSVLLLGENMPDHYIMMGVMFGIKEGLYWSCSNIIECEGVEKSDRRRFQGQYSMLKNVTGILIPIILGGIIYKGSFWAGTFIMTLFVATGVVLSMFYKDIKKENIGKFEFKKVFMEQKKDRNLRLVGMYHLFSGMIYSHAAFGLFANVYMLKIFNDSMKAGWMNAVNSSIACLLGFLLIKVLKNRNRMKITCAGAATLLTASVIILVSTQAPWAAIMFYIVYGIYKESTSNIDSILYNNVMCSSKLLRENKSEYSLLVDTWLFVGRMSGYILLAAYAFTGLDMLILVFLVPIAITAALFCKLLNTDINNAIMVE